MYTGPAQHSKKVFVYPSAHSSAATRLRGPGLHAYPAPVQSQTLRVLWRQEEEKEEEQTQGSELPT